MRVGIAADHGGFAWKEDLVARLRTAGHDIVDVGVEKLIPDDDYPDFVIPLGEAVVAVGARERGVAVCGRGVGASICTNKIPGVRAGLIHDHFPAGQSRGRPHERHLLQRSHDWASVAWNVVQAFLAAEFSQAPLLELQPARTNR